MSGRRLHLVVGKPQVRVVLIELGRRSGVRIRRHCPVAEHDGCRQKVLLSTRVRPVQVRVRAIGEFRASVALEANDCLFVKGRLGQSRQSRSSGRGTGPSAIDRLNRQRSGDVLANVRPVVRRPL